MTRRITISLDQRIESRIRNVQATKMVESNKSISFSKVINEVLKQGLKEFL